MSDRELLLKIERDLKALDDRGRFNRLSLYEPYEKQQEFHDLGADKRERLLMAGNQNGKTFCGGNEVAYHLTGRYPDGWLGRRWNRPTRGWVAGVTGESTRDNPQRILLGTTADILAYGPGTGSIPKDCLDREKMTLARGVADLYDTIVVKHFGPNGKQDGWSEFKFKSYERGRTKWQGDTLDWIWFDEEPPMDIYSEGLARISATNGMVFITFTPLEGLSEVVMRFMNEKSPDRSVTVMTIDDAKHIPVEERAKIIAGFPEHEREARARGVPMLGEGKIFQFAESDIRCDPFQVPRHWAFLWGLDFGIRHPFAAVLLAWDKDNDCIYVVKTIRLKGALPLAHVAAMRPCLDGIGNKIPAAWPQDGWQREEFDGKLLPLAQIYKKHGQRMGTHHATWPDGSNSTEAGIMEMQERFSTGRLKVFATETGWFDEYRLYHRKDGEIVKLNDDLMSATRVGIMEKRAARMVWYDVLAQSGGGTTQVAKDAELDDPWNY